MAIFAKNVRFLYYKEANKKRHLPLKVAPMCAKAHIIRNSVRQNLKFLSFFNVCLHCEIIAEPAELRRATREEVTFKCKDFRTHLLTSGVGILVLNILLQRNIQKKF